ncbi:PLC-like phosphodiesterase [Tirmania nivea]|nr:PLC-like phosphodiesterase [Tirmania nivea]
MFLQQSALFPALFAVTALFSSAFAAPGRNGLTKRQYDPAACNNHPSLCTKKYDQIYWLGAHDSPFIRHPENGYSVAGNQYFNVHTQLEAGVRLLQGQIHNEGGKPRLCHSECKMMDGGRLEDYLVEVKDWLDKHPSDVVTMLWVNADNMPAKDLEKYFVDTGMGALAYIPPHRPLKPGEWPTLKEMVDSGKRLVLFLSGGTDEAAIPWMLDEFQYMFETPFENFDPAKFTCAGDRPGSVKGPEMMQEAVDTRIGFQNRFLYDKKLEQLGLEIYTPDPKRQRQINSGDQTIAGNLKDGIEKCATEWGRRGGYILVDFFNEGNPIAVVDAANGFNDPRNRVNAPLSYENAPKELWQPTKSSGEMSLLFDKGADAVDEVVSPVKDVVDDIQDEVEDKVKEVQGPIEDIKDDVKDLFGGLFGR